MSYTKQNFVSGQILKADHLNYMEDGIEALANGIEVKTIAITDGSAMVPGMVTNDSGYTVGEIVGFLRNAYKYHVLIELTIMVKGGSEMPIRHATRYDLMKSSVGNKATVYFGDDVAPIIFDGDNNTLEFDPDWVTPVSVQEISDSVNALKNPFSFFANYDGSYLLVDSTYDEINSMDRFGWIRAVYCDNTAPAGTVDSWASAMPCLHVRKVFSMTTFKSSYEFTFMNMERSGYLTLRLNADGTIEKVN